MAERIIRSFVKTADMSVEPFLRNIREQAAKVNDLARLIDGERKIFNMASDRCINSPSLRHPAYRVFGAQQVG